MRVEPFSIQVDAGVLDDLRHRVKNTRLPEPAPGSPWAQGTDRDWLDGLLEYWADGFDWRAAERDLNRFAQYHALVDGAEIHFVHERARHGTGILLGPAGRGTRQRRAPAAAVQPVDDDGEVALP